MSGLVAALWLVTASAVATSAPEADAHKRPNAVATQLGATEVALGTPFEYRVRVAHAADERVELVPPQGVPADGSAPLALLGHDRRRSDVVGSAETSFTLKFALLELGSRELPSLTFQISRGGAVRTIDAPGATVKGLSSLPPDVDEKGAELLDIKPPESVWVRSWALFGWLAAVVAAALAAYALHGWWRRRAARARPPAPPLPLDVRTLSALDALEREQLPAQGRVREYYFRLSDIVREYLGERYAVDALECTSGELLQRLQPALVAAPAPLAALRGFLDEADLAKFARAEPTPAASAGAMQFARQLVRDTFTPPVPNAPGPTPPSP